MISSAINPTTLAPAWLAFQRALPIKIGVIQSEAEYAQAIAFINSLLEIVGDDESHELADLLDLVGQLAHDYEAIREPVPNAEPREVLRFLLDQNGLKQSDLAQEVGGQSTVSAILNGKRELNTRQIKALAARFAVSAKVFI